MAGLSQNTGLSRGFFYKNAEVKSVLAEEKEKTDQSKMAQIRKAVREKSLEKQVEIYQNELKKLLEENKRLKKENLKLSKKLENTTLPGGMTCPRRCTAFSMNILSPARRSFRLTSTTGAVSPGPSIRSKNWSRMQR